MNTWSYSIFPKWDDLLCWRYNSRETSESAAPGPAAGKKKDAPLAEIRYGAPR